MATPRISTITTIFRGAEYVRTSRNGNPTFRVVTDDGTYLTETDGSIGYSIGNYTNSRIGLIGKPVVLTLTRNGRVTHMTGTDTNNNSTEGN